MKKTVKDVDVRGKRVLVRCDFNVPMREDGVITNDVRIIAAIPTINYLIEHGARIILMSHMGRPDGTPDPKYTLKPVAERLEHMLPGARRARVAHPDRLPAGSGRSR